MPTGEEHLRKYKKNKLLLDSDEMKVDKEKPHCEWIVTVSFYSALHLIEKEIFENENVPADHTTNHRSRTNFVRNVSIFRNIRTNYMALKDACWKARYTADTIGKNEARQALEDLKRVEEELLKEEEST